MILIAAALFASAPTAGPAKPLAYPKVSSACTDGDSIDDFTCRALAKEEAGDFAASAGEFEKLASRIGEGDPERRDRAWAAAGNMWLAARQPKQAAVALDNALSGASLKGQQLGMTQLDRARSAEASGDLKTARTMVRAATVTISADPYLYYFSAVLAKRENDLPGARSAINRALSMAPQSSEVLLEAGNIATLSGEPQAARDYWAKAVAAGPGSAAGRTAQANLSALDTPMTVTNQVATRPDGDGEGQDQPEN